MARKLLRFQQALAVAIVLALAAPMAVYAKDGKKHFKEGLKFEENSQWDKAAEKFALALADKPSNIEYRLHLQRALVNAGVMLVERGDALAEKKDYNAAYQMYRQAYAFDSTNEVALIKMRRMLEAQGLPTESLPKSGDPTATPAPGGDLNVKATYNFGPGGVVMPSGMARIQRQQLPARRFPKTDVIYHGDSVMTIIEQLGGRMGLNVMFDAQVANQLRGGQFARASVDLHDVTYPKALEMILKTNNLMYSQLDTRTIVIAQDSAQSRMRYEPYAVRTFYIKNADITDISNAIRAALPGQRQIQVVKQLNALLVRDTATNLELIESMINSLDKSKAEVLIDINIYEVSRNDLLRIGNQFNIPGDDGQKNNLNLSFIGGFGQQKNILNSGAVRTLTGPFGIGLGLPPSLVSFFQDTGKAKLLASTQVHVLDKEQQSIRIGQRVPIQSAFIPTFQNTTVVTGRRGQVQPGVPGQPGATTPVLDESQFANPFGGFGSGFPQFQYENVGLNIDMTPEVFDNEVQMKMKIESSSLDRSTGNFTPSFNQRTMNSVARIKDGQTTLVAGVSQTEQAKQVRGLPLIGLIPILGRFFATPQTTDRQSDVVITVTPHILRKADIREDDYYARAAGTAQDPSTQLTIEQILYVAQQLDEQERNQIAAGGAPAPAPRPETKVATPPTPVVSPQREGVVVIPAGQPPTQPGSQALRPTVPKPEVVRQQVDAPGVPQKEPAGAQPKQPPATPAKPQVFDDDDDDDDDDDEPVTNPNQRMGPVTVVVRSTTPITQRNAELIVAVIVAGNADVAYVNLSLNYDPAILEVKGVRDSGVMSQGGVNPNLQFQAQGGILNVQMERPPGSRPVPAQGQLIHVIFSVKGQGQSPLTLTDQTFMRSASGSPLQLRLQSSQVEAR